VRFAFSAYAPRDYDDGLAQRSLGRYLPPRGWQNLERPVDCKFWEFRRQPADQIGSPRVTR
jgi:hypothetical protein